MLQKYLYYTSIMPDAPEIVLNYAQNDALIIGILEIYPRVLILTSRNSTFWPSWPKNQVSSIKSRLSTHLWEVPYIKMSGKIKKNNNS